MPVKQNKQNAKSQRTRPRRSRRRRRGSASRRRGAALVPGLSMPSAASSCVREWLTALRDPRAMQPLCWPAANPQASISFYTKINGSATIGTSGEGFVAFTPSASTNTRNYEIPQTFGPVTYSTSTFAGTSADSIATSVAAAGVSNPNLTGPYAYTTFGSGFQARVVLTIARIRYTGTELNRAGVIYAMRTLGGDTIAGSTPSNLMGYPTTRSSRPTDDWHYIVLVPPTLRMTVGAHYAADQPFGNGGYGIQYSTSPWGWSDGLRIVHGLFWLTGVVGMQYEFEIYNACEAIGGNNGLAVTPRPNVSTWSDYVQPIVEGTGRYAQVVFEDPYRAFSMALSYARTAVGAAALYRAQRLASSSSRPLIEEM